MAKPGGIAGRVQEIAEPVAKELGLELLEVKYVKEGQRYFLRLIIDKRGGINIDDCEALSRKVDPLIDEQVEIRQAYYLEVQSPGLDRPLKTTADLERYIGEEAEVRFYKAREGAKTVEGVIEAADDETLSLRINEEIKCFPRNEIALVKRVIRF